MASRKKKPPFTEIDLAIIATAPAEQKKPLIRAATGARGYPHYKGFYACLPAILSIPVSSLLPAPRLTKRQVLAAVHRACKNGPGEKDNNKAIAAALFDYVGEHKVTADAFSFDPVVLGRADKRCFWAPYILLIDGKKYIPFFDPRRQKGLTAPPRRFVFSINHSHIRLGNPIEFSDVGFVIFQFDRAKTGQCKVVPHFDTGIEFWSDEEIGSMIDEVYRLLDEIRKAA